MARAPYRPGAYSRFIGYVKIALPLLAIALLSTVFLVQSEDTIEGGITFSKNDRDTIRDGLTVYNPKFSGVNLRGDRYFLEALKATPDSAEPDEVMLEGVDGRTDYVSGLSIYLTSERGMARLPQQRLNLEGGVTIKTSEGYEGKTEAGVLGLDNGSFVSKGPVTLSGPPGQIEAGSLRIESLKHPDAAQENQVFWFENGVKLTYLPN